MQSYLATDQSTHVGSTAHWALGTYLPSFKPLASIRILTVLCTLTPFFFCLGIRRPWPQLILDSVQNQLPDNKFHHAENVRVTYEILRDQELSSRWNRCF